MPRKQSRKRRIAKWTGAALCLLILAAWGASLRFGAGTLLGDRGFLIIIGNRVTFGVMDGTRAWLKGPVFQKHEWYGPDIFRVPRVFKDARRNLIQIDVPLSLVFLAVGAPTVILFYRDRRRIPPGHCQKCGYNLTGNVSGICPECGTKTGAAAAAGG